MNYCPTCGAAIATKLIDGSDRLTCSRECGYIHWNNPTPVVAGLVKLGDEYILARNATWPEGWFSVITGFLEAGEVPHEAIAREAKEELGLTAVSTTFVGHYPFPKMNQIIMGYVVEAIGQPSANEEIAEIRRLGEGEIFALDFGPLKLAQAMVRDWKSLGEGNNINARRRI